MRFAPKINATNAGISLAVKLLTESPEKKLTAGDMSQAMRVSTARVAVLLQKMESRGLISKESDKTDGRVTIVRLTGDGEKFAETMRRTAIERISMVIDKLGEEKFLQFASLNAEFNEAVGEVFAFYSDKNDNFDKADTSDKKE